MEKKYKFLYLDDNDKVTRDGDVEYLNTISDRIEINTDYPGSWSQRANQILAEISSIDGVILDWELTNKSELSKQGAEQAETVDFSAESLAEHLRVNVILNSTKDIPIILCSADKNKAFSTLRKKELTSNDLFDLTFIKSDLFDKNAKIAESQLFDLADTYFQLQNNKPDVQQILNIEKTDFEFLDIRFLDSLESTYNHKTAHDFVQFLLLNFINREGILINEATLASRLGIDIDQSQDWGRLKQIIIDSKVIYQGLLSNGWENFWAFKLEKWWLSEISREDLRTMGASTRVAILQQKLQLKLTAAEKIKYCSSDEFWTVCQGLKKPLDPSNGFLIGETLFNPWLEGQYISALAELEKSSSEDWRINVMDRERYNSFKLIISKSIK